VASSIAEASGRQSLVVAGRDEALGPGHVPTKPVQQRSTEFIHRARGRRDVGKFQIGVQDHFSESSERQSVRMPLATASLLGDMELGYRGTSDRAKQSKRI
jgi:hypothetical protein